MKQLRHGSFFSLGILLLALAVALAGALPLGAQEGLPAPSASAAEAGPARSDTDGYRTPDEEIVRILDAPDLPETRPGPGGEWLLLLFRPNMPELAELARPREYLAGYRVDPATNGPAIGSTPLYHGLVFHRMEDGHEVEIRLPSGGGIDHVSWSPDGSRVVFSRVGEEGYELWGVSAGEEEPRRVTEGALNPAHDRAPCSWIDASELLCHFVPPDRGPAPERPVVPEGPVIQEAADQPAPVRTFQDLLANPHEADLYEHYFTSQIKRVEVDGGERTPVREPAIFDQVSLSPDREHLFVSRTVRPFSYVVPDRWRINDWFPREMEIWTMDGERVNHLASLPLVEEIPVDSMRAGPRDVHWQPGHDAALVWVEKDEDDPEVSERLYRMPDPNSATEELATLTDFHWSTRWVDGRLALLTEVNRYPYRSVSRERTWIVDPEEAGEPRLLWDFNPELPVEHPGDPLGGRSVASDGEWIYLTGEGLTAEGKARPLLERMHLGSGEREELWRSEEGFYEEPVHVLGSERSTLVTRRESRAEHPNYHLRRLGEGRVRAITQVEDPAPALQDVEQRVLRYERADGVELAARVYLPPDYEEGDRVPAILWAYPREYADPDAAAELPNLENRFTRVTGASHLFFLLRGYAVIDNASMAIVGGRLGYPEEPNDTYIEQLVMSAEAALDAVEADGAVDPDRIGIGGGSYGGFMTTNVLAHSDRFAAGIAARAAHNRTLTPFGFQNEQRTLWEAREVYVGMSPFMYADRIRDPVLLIHGADDPNPGTFPMQSERMFHALKGLGNTQSRLVMMEHEDHSFSARESVHHVLVEMFEWFDEHVKGASGR